MAVSEEQRARIRELAAEGKRSPEIAQLLGLKTMVVAGIRAAWKRAQGQTTIEEADAIETTFGLERDLQEALRQNIGQLEHGLKIIDNGKERHVPAGFIDITAEDGQGRTVVIELKAGTADRETIGQILGYMGDLQRESKKPVRGIIVAGDFTIHTKSALSALPNLELKEYGFKFSFEAVNRDTDDSTAKS